MLLHQQQKRTEYQNPFDQEFIDSIPSYNFVNPNHRSIPFNNANLNNNNNSSFNNVDQNQLKFDFQSTTKQQKNVAPQSTQQFCLEKDLKSSINNNSFFSSNTSNILQPLPQHKIPPSLNIFQSISPDIEVSNKINNNNSKPISNTKIQYSNSTFIPSRNSIFNNNSSNSKNTSIYSNNTKPTNATTSSLISSSSSTNSSTPPTTNTTSIESINSLIQNQSLNKTPIKSSVITPFPQNSPSPYSIISDSVEDSYLIDNSPPYSSSTSPTLLSPLSLDEMSTEFSISRTPTPQLSTSIQPKSTFKSSPNQQSPSNVPKSRTYVPAVQKSTQQLITDLVQNERREDILNEIVNRSKDDENIPTILWYSPSVVSILVQEIVSIYKYITNQNPKLKARASNRVSNTLTLLQLIAFNSSTKKPFFKSNIVCFIHPFLKTTCDSKPFEYLRLASLNIIGSLIESKNEDNSILAFIESKIIPFLIESEIFLPCLSIMEVGSELSKTAATLIIKKILNANVGLNYFTQPSILPTVLSSLKKMVDSMYPAHMSSRLLKHIVRCYLRLSENVKIRYTLKDSISECFFDGNIEAFIFNQGDVIVKRWFTQFKNNMPFIYTDKKKSKH
ncbi:cell differentiation family [Tieghemostelium lacteum]|uniref:Cell differentiation family n=1 Tax=Tieghemostelium lacteum TaxID=361077 RepID=A0A151ZDF5_TIELA|nr:cell differentiation family [Tieghemostelium lacteum]|eukprot:KYQ91992.1 cell differentiation family [Tieghemostelium lacteum]